MIFQSQYFFCRLAPESLQDLEEFVQNFFAGFPCTTATCVSLLGGPYAGLLQEMLQCNSSTHSWMLVSRLDSKSQPIVLLLPMDSILEGNYFNSLLELRSSLYYSGIVIYVTVEVLNSLNILSEASDEAGNSGVACCSESKNLDKHWKCPWGTTMVDDVAPEFRQILEENYISSSSFPLEDTAEGRKLWWTRRKKLDHRLGKFLR